MSVVRLGAPGQARFHTPVLPLTHGKHLFKQWAMPRAGEVRRRTISNHSDIPSNEEAGSLGLGGSVTWRPPFQAAKSVDWAPTIFWASQEPFGHPQGNGLLLTNFLPPQGPWRGVNCSCYTLSLPTFFHSLTQLY